MPIFPVGRDAYKKEAAWGTLIKMYEYAAASGIYSNTHILMKGGLLGRLNLLLPDPALPVRLYECRQGRSVDHQVSCRGTYLGVHPL